MQLTAFSAWISTTPLAVVGAALFAAMAVAALGGYALRARGARPDQAQEGYIVSAVTGLLALLLGFTFGLAVERYEARRELVVAEANAIGTIYLRAQLLPEPHRSRLSGLLVRYTENRLALGSARSGQTSPLLAVNDRLLTDLWAATCAAFDDIRTLPVSTSLVEGMNAVIDMDAARKAARGTRVPTEVFLVLIIYLIGAAGVLGRALTGAQGRLSAGFLMALFILSLLLIVDIDRPRLGGVLESQQPMEALARSLAEQPPRVFDRWRAAAAVRSAPAGPRRPARP